MKRGILYLIIFAGFLASCKKYEDGPFISLRSPENRIIGRYKLYTYTVNGVDSINLFNDSLYNEFNFFDGKIYGYDAVNGCTIDGLRNDSNIFHLSWVWKLDNDNKILKVTKASVYAGNTYWHSGTGPFVNNAECEWEILRLTNNEIKMKTNFKGKEYLIKLKIS